jgi:hypothetical protein
MTRARKHELEHVTDEDIRIECRNAWITKRGHSWEDH